MAASHQPLIPSLANSAARVETRRKRRLTSERKEVGLAVHGEQVRWLEPSWLKLADRPPAAGQERRTLKTPLSAYYALSRGREEWLNVSAAKWPHPLSLSLFTASHSLPASLPHGTEQPLTKPGVCVCAHGARTLLLLLFPPLRGLLPHAQAAAACWWPRAGRGRFKDMCERERERGGGVRSTGPRRRRRPPSHTPHCTRDSFTSTSL